MRYGSVCSGIEAATVAWHPLGWEPAWFAEIEPFPCAVLAHHYPAVPNLGDMTTIRERVLSGEVEAPSVLVGGTPCQAFSVAGLRGGLSDARGNLALEFVRLADAIDAVRRAAGQPPAWILWENVPGALTVDDGAAFGSILGGLVGSESALLSRGGWERAGVAVGPSRCAAWRHLDAQFFSLAQRRDRLFVCARGVVGGAGEWDGAEALLPVIARMSWDYPARSKAGTRSAPAPAHRSAFGGWSDDGGGDEPLAFDWRKGGDETTRLHATPESPTLTDSGPHAVMVPEVAHSLSAQPQLKHREDADTLVPVASHALCAKGGVGRFDPNGETLVPVIGGSFDPTPDEAAAGRRFLDAINDGREPDPGDVEIGNAYWERQPPIPFDTTQITSAQNRSAPAPGDPAHPLAAGAHPPAIAFSMKDYGADAGPISPTLRSGNHDKSHANGGVMPAIAFHVTQDPISSDGATLGCGNALGCGTLGVAIGFDPGQSDLPKATIQAVTEGTGPLIRARVHAVATPSMAVRRLTPRECERLQGFPDDYTAIPGAKDGPRYRALGNSMAVPCMRWIGTRIQMVEDALAASSEEAA